MEGERCSGGMKGLKNRGEDKEESERPRSAVMIGKWNSQRRCSECEDMPIELALIVKIQASFILLLGLR